ncbi:hypothetical protein QC763_120411 [Podospora pseudopauciseta]|uniref:Uncharacterized protein n=1 Tax=Podospora pseudopauciseta TaxID=2093780 RepID=A0ABR0I211_9PEZI|nr:hypothetical protein QC763_120411 [Podospora pseudopauciseta]
MHDATNHLPYIFPQPAPQQVPWGGDLLLLTIFLPRRSCFQTLQIYTMADVQQIHNTIKAIAHDKTHITIAHVAYQQNASRLRVLLDTVAVRHGFTTGTVTKAMVGPVGPGNFSPLVAGWVYRHLWNLRQSERMMQDIMNPREYVNQRYNVDQLRSWTNTICRPPVHQQNLEEIAKKLNGIPQELRTRLRRVISENAKIQQRISRIENTPGGVDVAALLDDSDEGSSGDEDTC